MSKALKVIGTIAGAVALVATGVGAFAGAAFAASATGATVAAVATYAGLVAGVAGIGAALLQKAPPARGSVSQVVIQADAPSPYVMGEGLFAGIVRHDTAYGPTLNKVPNPYRFIAALYCVAGPIHSITPYVDQGPVSSWYSGFLYTDTQLGATPEADALSPQWSGAPGWGASSKLSGKAAIGWSFKFDKDGKRFASGLPAISAYGKWVKVYDPRKDSTFPGGSGSHRIGVESTYEWSENPALHAGTYAFGRYQNAKRVMGVGLPKEAINWNAIAGWANVCDLNEWSIFGVVYEPGDRWANMRDICFAGGAEPVFSGGVLSFRYSAPKVPLDTITEVDLIDDNASVTAMASWRDRINSVVPKYRSPAHNWELIPASPVTVSSYVTEDGEIKSEEIPFNFVKKADQAEQLAAYRLVDGRELQPITITCGPRLFAYRPGECLHLTLPSLSLDTDAVILRRDFDPARMTVTFTLIGETPEKHDFALGKTGTAPATPALKQTGEERDELSSTVVIGVDGIDGAPGAPGADGVTLYTWYAYADTADGVLNFTNGSPNNRVYQGISPNRTTATESTNPADYTWSPYVGPPSFGLAATGGAEVSGAKIVRRSGSAWEPQIYSTESFTGAAFLSFKPEINVSGGYGGVMIGLNTDPTTASWESLDYAIYLEQGSGNLYNAESGVLTPAGSYSGTDTFAIHYNGSTVQYSRNGIVFRTVAASAGTRFFLDSAIASNGVCATITAWAAAGSIGPQGATGPAGANGANGAPGAPAIGFVQDANPGAGQFVSQTWYRPTSKEWYRWTGGSWERILGDLSAQNLIASSAFIADGVIINGKIANLAVDTLKIAGNAVTAPFAASTSSPVFLPAPADSITDILSLSLTPTNINSAYLSLSSDAANTHASYSYIAQFQIVINGSLVFTSENMLLSPQGIAGNTGFWSHSGIFPVNVGSSNSIVLRVKTIGYYANTSVRVTNRSIFALELKR